MAAQSDYVLTYTGKFGGHGITLTGGMTTNYNEYSSLDAGRSQKLGDGISIGENDDKWWITTIGDQSTATNGGSQYKRFTMSYLIRALYNYQSRYLFNASIVATVHPYSSVPETHGIISTLSAPDG